MAAVATASTSVRLPTGRIHLLRIGEPVPDEVVAIMSDDHRARCLILDTAHEAAEGETAEVGVLGYEPGTAEDPRLDGAPGTNQSAVVILEWVGHDLLRAEAVYDRELRKALPRKVLIEQLAALLDAASQD